jgi:hypothetical protein
VVQSAAWLVRERLNFEPSLVLLKEARNVTYKSFAAPGRVLTVTAQCLDLQPGQSTFDASGAVAGQEVVKGRLTLRHLKLSDERPGAAELDDRLRAQQRAMFELLWKGSADVRPGREAPAAQPIDVR